MNPTGSSMKTVFFTSMNRRYFDEYGINLTRSWHKHMQEQQPLHVYNEDFELDQPSTKMMGWNLGDDFEKFCQRWHNEKRVVIFAKKAFSIMHAMDHVEADRLIWIDSDVVIKKTLDHDLLSRVAPDDVLSSHFFVKHHLEGRAWHSCETGFFVLNKKHPDFAQFRDTYRHIYVTDDVTNIRRFYDGEVYGETVVRLQAQGVKMLDLSPQSKMHLTPIKKSVMAQYIAHYKGKSGKTNLAARNDI